MANSDSSNSNDDLNLDAKALLNPNNVKSKKHDEISNDKQLSAKPFSSNSSHQNDDNQEPIQRSSESEKDDDLNEYDEYEAEQDKAAQNGQQGPTFQSLFNSAKDKVNQLKSKPASNQDINKNEEDNQSTVEPKAPQPTKSTGNGCLPKLLVLGALIGGGWYGYHHFIGQNKSNKVSTFFNGKKETQSSNKIETNQADKTRYKYPSERDKQYPSPYKVTSLEVSLKDQRIYVMNGKQVIYTMLMTSGKNDTTPKGDFQIQAQQGKKSWSEQFKRGMNYWSSYNGDGKYVFSTIWTNQDGSYRVPSQNYLGVKPSTDNGNIQLTTPDAKFVYSLILGTPVKIY